MAIARKAKPAPPPPIDVGKVIRLACAAKGWSGADLGRALGVSRQRIADVVSGRVRPSPEWLARCAIALGISAAEFGREVARLTIVVDRPAAELELVLKDDGPHRADVLGTETGRSAELLASLGFPRRVPVDGPELVCLVNRARAAKVAVSIRTDLDTFA